MLELSPRGKVEEGEDELTAAIREVREETGLLPHNLWLFEDLKREVTYQECKIDIKSKNLLNCSQNPEGVEFTGSYWLTMLIDHDKTVGELNIEETNNFV